MISSRSNPRVVALRKLEHRKHRREAGLLLAEGASIIESALAAGASPAEAWVAPELVDDATRALLGRLEERGAAVVEVSPGVMGTLAERDPPQGILVTFPLPLASLAGLRLSGRELVVVVDRLQDPGNVGAIVRTAAAVGAAAVVLIAPSCDPFDPKAVRGSMGSVFQVPVIEAADPAEAIGSLRRAGLRIVGAEARDGSDPRRALAGGVALLLGNETRGLSPDLAPLVDERVTLPLPGGAESLNVAVAGGVLMYCWLWGVAR
jgi:TrmH family RNA methyltransferase